MSLQTGTRLATATEAIIDPRTLQVVALFVDGPLLSSKPAVLHTIDIRELSDIGIIVDSDAKLMPLDDLVRLQTVLDYNFELVGLRVADEQGHKLGKVKSYVVDLINFEVQQVYTEHSLLRSFNTIGSTIARSQIVSVDNAKMVVQSPRISEKVKKPANQQPLVPFVNPFRGSSQPETKEL